MFEILAYIQTNANTFPLFHHLSSLYDLQLGKCQYQKMNCPTANLFS